MSKWLMIIELLVLHSSTWNHLTVCKQMSSDSFKNYFNQTIRLQIINIWYISINRIFHKTKPTNVQDLVQWFKCNKYAWSNTSEQFLLWILASKWWRSLSGQCCLPEAVAAVECSVKFNIRRQISWFWLVSLFGDWVWRD